MTADYLFRDLYHDRFGDPANPNAVDPPSSRQENSPGRGLLGRLAGLFRRRKHASAWSFTIPSDMDDMEGEAEVRRRASSEDPKFLAMAKALSRNC
ncbi:MAG: hypothetical protein E6Q40_02870 [Cupriavidus sp.]|nr:MAG: hypothetical protein E6Q40_02870 [Cupriavidus sp.]